MPEGDTIHRTAAALDRALAGRIVTRFESVLVKVALADDNHRIAGRTVERCEAIGKHVLVHFSGGLALRTHMRMSGSWHLYRRGERWQRPRGEMRVAIETDERVAVVEDSPKPPSKRMTLTMPYVLGSKQIWIVAVGPRKVPVLKQAIERKVVTTPVDLVVAQSADVTVFTDQAIAH